ncbi:unnamed protein product [Rhizoctonia solani]|uniref:CNH domain-containing protein n=1 Tax=Rhizoctonia solani TaxID=456999 RepID=A0A8H3DY30_9AGAM|nr:unnamed protein product [Rhizoctonia solani]
MLARTRTSIYPRLGLSLRAASTMVTRPADWKSRAPAPLPNTKTKTGEVQVNCVTLYNKDRTVVYGTDDGVYLQPQNGPTRKAFDLAGVQQVDVLEDLSLLVVRAERSVLTFPLDELETEQPVEHTRRITLASQTSFFKTGMCMSRMMICIVKTASLSSTFKVLKSSRSPTPESNQRGRTSSPDDNKLKPFKEFYIARESYLVQFLKSKLCVVAASGFEIVDFETLNTQALLDPVDQRLAFVRRVGPRPLRMYRIGGEFLVCYREFAFYVDSSGKKSERDVVIHWEGTPSTCGKYFQITQRIRLIAVLALHYPYIIAFSPNFVEIRHVDDGSLVQIILESDVRCLYAKGSLAEDLAYHLSRQREKNVLVSHANRVTFLTPNMTRADRRHSK